MYLESTEMFIRKHCIVQFDKIMKEIKKNLVILAAGTGGHVYPGLCIAKNLILKNVNIFWIGTKNGMEKDIIKGENISFHHIDFSGVRGKGLKVILKLPFKIAKASYQAFMILKKISPNAILSMGGYISFPCVIAGIFLNRPIIIHEQNIVFGLANNISRFFSKLIIVGFPMSIQNEKYKFLGNPSRYEGLPRKKATHNKNVFNIAVIGGSLGAKVFNEIIPKAVYEILRKTEYEINIIHQTGKTHKSAEIQYNNFEVNIDLREYIDDMSEVYEWCDLIICRGGAITLTEIMNQGIPAIVIPYPYAVDNHQLQNCSFLEKRDAIILIDQKNLTEKYLANIILKLINNVDLLNSLSENIYNLNNSNSTEEICNEIENIMKINK